MRWTAFALCWVLGVCTGAAGQAQEESIEFTWISRGSNLEALAGELSRLYQSLMAHGKLDTREVLDEEGRRVEVLLRDEGQYFGAYFDRQVDSVVCRLNSKKCEVRTPLSDEPPEIRWLNSAGDRLRIPDFEFEKTFDWVPERRAAIADLARHVTTTLGSCEAFDEDCRRFIVDNNGGNEEVLEPSYPGRIWLPALQLKTRLELEKSSELFEKIRSNLVTRAVINERPVPQKNEPPELWIDPLGADWMSQATSGRPISRHVWGFGGGRETTSGPAPDARLAYRREASAEADLVWELEHSYEEASAAYEAIVRPSGVSGLGGVEEPPEPRPVHPVEFASLYDWTAGRPPMIESTEDDERRRLAQAHRELMALVNMPPLEELQRRLIRTTGVLVLDNAVDPSHCAFDATRLKAVDGDTPASAKECGTPDEANIWDHGTHIVGLIVAKEIPEHGSDRLHGFNPFARVIAYKVAKERFDVEKGRDQLSEAVRLDNARVVNASFDYERLDPGAEDLFFSKVKEWEDEVLVVAAAGNDGFDHTGGCDKFPACFDLDNVISVAALNRSKENPELWRNGREHSSDYGSPDVHIAAPGEEISSTLKGNRIGTDSGTSQAAPLVTATASLIYGMKSLIDPYKVRNHLIYSSELVPALEEKVLGGRLDVGRALGFEHDQVRLAPGSVVECKDGERTTQEEIEVLGKITYLGERPGEQDLTFPVCRKNRICRTGHGPPDYEWVNLKDVKRLALDEFEGLYTTFELSADPNPKRLRRSEVRLESPGRVVLMEVEEGPEWVRGTCKFKMGSIVDYVSRIR